MTENAAQADDDHIDLTVPEEYDGSGYGMVELVPVFE